MLHKETLEAYRKMTPGERLALTCEMTSANMPYLFMGTEEQVKRKFELLWRENDERNKAVLDAFRSLRKRR